MPLTNTHVRPRLWRKRISRKIVTSTYAKDAVSRYCMYRTWIIGAVPTVITYRARRIEMIRYFDYDDKPRVVCCECGHLAIQEFCEPVKTGPNEPRMYRCARCARLRKD